MFSGIEIFNLFVSDHLKNIQKTTFEAAKMMPGPWNQQTSLLSFLESFSFLPNKHPT